MLNTVEARVGWAPEELAERVRVALRGGACAVHVPGVGLTGDPEQRRVALGEIAGLITGDGPVEVREVRNQAVGADTAADDTEARHHTDSALVPEPERYFLLYPVRAPRCGGGVRFLRDGRLVERRLARTPAGRDALRVLRETELAWRMPKSLRAPGQRADFSAPVLAEHPLWRWRPDKIDSGLRAHPERDTPALRAALAAVTDLLADPADDVRIALPDDHLLIVDNHVTLHGRTAFTDPDRRLLRARWGK